VITACVILAGYLLHVAMLVPAAAAPGRKVNILLLGVDVRQGDRGRADTIIVASLDYLTHDLRVLSFPRDTRVLIPGRGYDKANAAYAYGGPELTAETVSGVLGIPIHYYISTDFAGLVKVIDRLGGLVVTVDKPMRYDDPYQNLHINIKAGTQVMDGKTTLDYARYRSDPEGDIARVRRQQALVIEILKKAARPQSWGALSGLLADFKEMVRTNISGARLPSLGLALLLGSRSAESKTLPGKPSLNNGAWYWIVETSQTRQMVRDFLGIGGR
jgi:LCP family protein required for cell wall assembly